MRVNTGGLNQESCWAGLWGQPFPSFFLVHSLTIWEVHPPPPPPAAPCPFLSSAQSLPGCRLQPLLALVRQRGWTQCTLLDSDFCLSTALFWLRPPSGVLLETSGSHFPQQCHLKAVRLTYQELGLLGLQSLIWRLKPGSGREAQALLGSLFHFCFSHDKLLIYTGRAGKVPECEIGLCGILSRFPDPLNKATAVPFSGEISG